MLISTLLFFACHKTARNTASCEIYFADRNLFCTFVAVWARKQSVLNLLWKGRYTRRNLLNANLANLFTAKIRQQGRSLSEMYCTQETLFEQCSPFVYNIS